MIDFSKLFAEAAKIPLPTDEQIRQSMEGRAGDIWPISICPKCGNTTYGHRLGCWRNECENSKVLGSVTWLFQAASGKLDRFNPSTSNIEHGKDFLFIEERPATAAKD